MLKNFLNKIKWLGHASFLINSNRIIYIDPWKLQKNLPKADIILITQEHHDHCLEKDINSISKESTIIVCNKRTASRINKLNLKIVHPYESVNINEVKIKVTPAYNINKPFHPKEEDLGFVIEVEGTKVYHCGDTDFIPEMKNINCDVALLAVSGTYVMTAYEAADAAKIIKPKIAIPMHYGSIVGTKNDTEIFKKLFEENNIEVYIFQNEEDIF